MRGKIRIDKPNISNNISRSEHEISKIDSKFIVNKVNFKVLIFSSTGKSKVEWEEKEWEGSGEDRRQVTKHVKSKEKFFSHKTNLFGASSGGHHTTIHPHGYFTYPFVFNIPHNIPSSFEGSVGRIRYELKGIMSC